METVWFIVLASVTGVAIILQGQFMGLMDLRLGTRESVFVTYASGAVVALLIMLPRGWRHLRGMGELPLYVYTAGVLGLIIIGSIGYVMPRLGGARTFTLIVASQFIMAAVVDHCGLFGAAVRPLDASRAVGLIVMLAGVWLVLK